MPVVSVHRGIGKSASEAGDETIVAVAWNGHVLSLHPTRERDTMVPVKWIGELAAAYGIAQRMPRLRATLGWLLPGNPDRYNGFPALFIVDEVGVGKGASDRLSELGYNVDLFNAARRPQREADSLLYANERARIAAKFRDLLIEGSVAIPDDEMLLQELRVYSAFTNQSGKLQCVAKDDLRTLLGRSPDRLDAVLMACAGPNGMDFSRVSAKAVAF